MKGLLAGSLLIGIAFGATTYPIVEPDLLQEIEQRAKIAQEKLKKKLEKTEIDGNSIMKDWRVKLTMPEKSYRYEVDMTATLPEDIPRVDNSGKITGILYPKGYKYNPLLYLPMDPPLLVVFDGRDKKQVELAKRLLAPYPTAMAIVSDGDVFELMKQLKRSVYLLNPFLRERLEIRHAVSFVRWDRKKGVAVVEVYGYDRVAGRNSSSNK